MIDVHYNEDQPDLLVSDTEVYKATNVLSVQLGALEYLSDFGIDLEYFLTEDIEFQDASFQGYLITSLANEGLNVAKLTTVLDRLFQTYKINLSSKDSSTGLIVR